VLCAVSRMWLHVVVARDQRCSAHVWSSKVTQMALGFWALGFRGLWVLVFSRTLPKKKDTSRAFICTWMTAKRTLHDDVPTLDLINERAPCSVAARQCLLACLCLCRSACVHSRGCVICRLLGLVSVCHVMWSLLVLSEAATAQEQCNVPGPNRGQSERPRGNGLTQPLVGAIYYQPWHCTTPGASCSRQDLHTGTAAHVSRHQAAGVSRHHTYTTEPTQSCQLQSINHTTQHQVNCLQHCRSSQVCRWSLP
jgi:hypothetical protein